MKSASILKNYRKWVIGLALVGILLASYLYYEYAFKETFGVCDINSVLNCRAVTTGNLSELWGIPVSLIGLAGYVIILVSATLRNFKLAFGMAVFGMVFCLRLMYLEIFVEGVLCLVCVACQAVMLAEFFLTYQLAYPEKVGLASKKR